MQRVQNERGATMRLNDILDSVVRDKISATDLVEIVRSKDWKISEADLARVQLNGEDDEEILLQEVKTGRQELVKSIYTQAASQMPEMGIELIDIRIKRIDYVEAVEQRVFDRMIAERQRIAEQFRSEGEGRAAEIDGDTRENSLRFSLRPTAKPRSFAAKPTPKLPVFTVRPSVLPLSFTPFYGHSRVTQKRYSKAPQL